jgi:hypothetical protein
VLSTQAVDPTHRSGHSKSIKTRYDKHTYASLSHPMLSGVVLQIFVGEGDRHAALADR